MRELLRQLIVVAKENRDLARENNIMLKEIISAINMYIKNADNENMQDFGRNILANLISNIIEGNINRVTR